jgi:hypothetical protein
MAEVYSQMVINKVKDIICDDTKGTITRWTAVKELLLAEKIAYEVELHSSMLLVHPENRAKLGVNPHNAHRVGASIKSVGADLKQLSNSVAFELNPMEPARAQQIGFNRSLVDHAGGLLAPITGGERYLTVSCGHTAQWVKAVNARCPSPQKQLLGKGGFMSPEELGKNDASLMSMFSAGWLWTVVPWQAEMTWPGLPDLAQRALNASNSVASQCSELEVASSIAEFAGMQAVAGEVSWDRCIAAVAASNPPCSEYIGVVAEYVRLFGGGAGAPMVKYLDAFAKVYGENRKIGQEFFTAVTECSFSTSPLNVFPHVRTGLLATNLVSPKVVDGLAKLLVKSDVLALCKKDKKVIAEQAEAMLSDAWDKAHVQVKAGTLTEMQVYSVMGKLHTRTILHLTGKAKHGFEKLEFKNLQEVRNQFESDIAKLSPSGVKTNTSVQPYTAQLATVASSASASGPVMLGLEELANPVRVAGAAGFVAGQLYIDKKTKWIYRLKQVDVESTFVRETLWDEQKEVQVNIVDMPKVFSRFQGQLQEKLQGWASLMVVASSRFAADELKAMAFIAIAEKAKAADAKNVPLTFCINPAEVRTTGQVPKGKLELVPATMINNMTNKKPVGAKGIEVTIEGCDSVWATEPNRPRQADGWKPDCIMVPYWWVTTTDNKDAANMSEKKVTDKTNGICFPVFINSRLIKANERLMVYKPSTSAEAGSSAGPVPQPKKQRHA